MINVRPLVSYILLQFILTERILVRVMVMVMQLVIMVKVMVVVIVIVKWGKIVMMRLTMIVSMIVQ